MSVEWKWRRPGINDNNGRVWDPQVEQHDNPQFTERNEHYQRLYEQAQRAQYSPAELRRATNSELIYLAAHDAPVPIDDHRYPGEGDERRNKLSQNAKRASAELHRRWASRQALVNGLLGSLLVAAIALAGLLARSNNESTIAPVTPTTVVTTTSRSSQSTSTTSGTTASGTTTTIRP
jgi:hypothetical protein